MNEWFTASLWEMCSLYYFFDCFASPRSVMWMMMWGEQRWSPLGSSCLGKPLSTSLTPSRALLPVATRCHVSRGIFQSHAVWSLCKFVWKSTCVPKEDIPSILGEYFPNVFMRILAPFSKRLFHFYSTAVYKHPFMLTISKTNIHYLQWIWKLTCLYWCWWLVLLWLLLTCYL